MHFQVGSVTSLNLFEGLTFCFHSDSYSETYQELEKRFKDLKEAIRERESIYENRSERAEIINLRASVEHIKVQMEHVMRKNQHGQFCLETLKQIIVKLTSDGANADIE